MSQVLVLASLGLVLVGLVLARPVLVKITGTPIIFTGRVKRTSLQLCKPKKRKSVTGFPSSNSSWYITAKD